MADDRGVDGAVDASVEASPRAFYGDAYVTHFTLVLRTILRERPDLRRLYSPMELALASAFLDDLSVLEQHVYARLFQRKGPWFKTQSVQSYFTSRRVFHGDAEPEEEAVEEEEDTKTEAKEDVPDVVVPVDDKLVQSTLQRLVNVGLLSTLSLLSPAFLSQQGQEEQLSIALEAIQQCATVGELTALWKKLNGGKGTANTKSMKRKNTGSPSSSPSVGRGGGSSNKNEIFQALKRLVTTQRRIDGSRIPIAKVMHQIWLQQYSIRRPSVVFGDAEDIIVVIRISDEARALFHRMHRLFYFQAASPFAGSSQSVVLAAAKRSKTFRDILLEKLGRTEGSSTSSAGPTRNQQWPGLMVLLKQIAFPPYSVTIEHPVFTSREVYVCYELASRMHRIMNSVEEQMVIEQLDDEATRSVPDGWREMDTDDDLFAHLPQLVAFQCLVLDFGDPEEGGISLWSQFSDALGRMTTFDEFILESRRCLRAFSSFHRRQEENTSEIPVFYLKCNAGYHLARVLHHASAVYEKQRDYILAISLLRDLLGASFLLRKRGYWYERLAVNLEHLKKPADALVVCEGALKDSQVIGADRIALERRLARLAARHQTIEKDGDFVDLVSTEEEQVKPDVQTVHYRESTIIGRPLNRATGERSRFIGYDDEPCTVEQLVIQHYNQRPDEDDQEVDGGGWYGLHCEGRILVHLFGLFMWDVLYANVADVFQSAYQVAPLDFGFAQVFYFARQAQIDELLSDIETRWTIVELIERLAATWRDHEGHLTRFVSWGSDDLPLLLHQLVVMALGPARLARLLRYMATSESFHRAQNGLPDVLLLRARLREGDLSSTLKGLLNEDTKCLDVYRLCGMSYSLNMNDIVPSTEEAGDMSDPSAPLQTVCADLASWDVEVRLVEVKGPRDRLSDQQELWLRILNEQIGVDSIVMHVAEDAARQAKRKNQVTKTSAKKKKTKSS
ncbi:hypothetical protein Poli38472_004456 [Pythium oligandrum]|uniref:Fanconi-associated nuclease n=1 Tax=Pythium oligandrum TaxID=41045 RepID=A0A8K1FH53_PYTOL|nr:hypothetical protein Poli38472_004456 [Pythium oligandrum]|eukprot:TMW59387.1 hypothetical protein Poli38472_004456 [Pythium oligandrum]